MKPGLYFTVIQEDNGTNNKGFYFPVRGGLEDYKHIITALSDAIIAISDSSTVEQSTSVAILVGLLECMQPGAGQITLMEG